MQRTSSCVEGNEKRWQEWNNSFYYIHTHSLRSTNSLLFRCHVSVCLHLFSPLNFLNERKSEEAGKTDGRKSKMIQEEHFSDFVLNIIFVRISGSSSSSLHYWFPWLLFPITDLIFDPLHGSQWHQKVEAKGAKNYILWKVIAESQVLSNPQVINHQNKYETFQHPFSLRWLLTSLNSSLKLLMLSPLVLDDQTDRIGDWNSRSKKMEGNSIYSVV